MDRRWGRDFILAWIALCLFAGVVAHGQVPVNGNPDSPDAARAAARRAAIASARGNLEAAQARVKAAEDRVRAESKANPDQANTQRELDEAQADLDRLGAPVLAKLRETNADYRAAIQDEEAAQAKLRDEQAKAVAAQPETTQPATQPIDSDPQDANRVQKEETSLHVPVPTDGQVVAAIDKLDVRSRRRDIEREALANDPATAQASARVEAATAKLKQMRAEFDARLLNDPEYKAARDQLAAARAELTRAASANY